MLLHAYNNTLLERWNRDFLLSKCLFHTCINVFQCIKSINKVIIMLNWWIWISNKEKISGTTICRAYWARLLSVNISSKYWYIVFPWYSKRLFMPFVVCSATAFISFISIIFALIILIARLKIKDTRNNRSWMWDCFS